MHLHSTYMKSVMCNISSYLCSVSPALYVVPTVFLSPLVL
jgi:hypothetical protein